MSAEGVWLRDQVLARLAQDAGVQGVFGDPARVFGMPTGAPAYPFVEIARHEVRPVDAADAPAEEHRIDLGLVSMEGDDSLWPGVAAVRTALAGWRPADEVWRCVTLSPVFEDTLRAPGRKQRAVLRLRVVVEPVMG